MKKKLLLVLLFVLPFIMQAQFTQQTNIYPANITAGDEFGSSVCIENEWLAVGAYYYDSLSTAPGYGAVYLWHSDGTSWTENQKIMPTSAYNGDQFGNVVAISDTSMIIGAWNASTDGDYNPGKVYFYGYDGTSWNYKSTYVCGINDYDLGYGSSVDISGNYAIVGAPGTFSNGGRAYVYYNDNGNWQMQQNLVHSTSDEDYFGSSVAIYDTIAFVGASGENKVHILTRSGTTWTEIGSIAPSSGTNSFGTSMDFDGTTLIVGDDGANAAYIYSFDGTSWVQQKIVADDASASDNFGKSVSISNNVAVVGAWGKSSMTGATYIFKNNSGVWSQSQKITASNGDANDRFGTSVAIDGLNIVVGAFYDNPNSMGDYAGSAYIFQSPPPPAPSIVVQPQNSAVCEGSSATFTVSANDATSYQWYNGNGILSNGGDISGANTNNLSIANTELADANTFYCVVSGDGGSTQSDNAVLSVESKVQANFSANPHITEYPYSIISFQNLSSDTLQSYEWNFGDGNSITDDNFISSYSHTYNTWGVFPVKLVVSGNVCTDTLIDTIVVTIPKPVLGGSLNNDTICGQDTAEFNASIMYAVDYQWFFNGVEIADTGAYVGTNTSNLKITSLENNYIGNYYCKGANDSGFVYTDTVTIVVGDEVSALFTATPIITEYPFTTISVQNSSTDTLVSYFWDWGDGDGLIDYNYISVYEHTYDTSGVYLITLEVWGNICSDIDTQSVIILASNTLFEDDNDFILYPNPSKDYVTISGISGEKQVYIYDVQGKLIYETKNSSDDVLIDVSGFKSSVYSVTIRSKDRIYLKKLIVE